MGLLGRDLHFGCIQVTCSSSILAAPSSVCKGWALLLQSVVRVTTQVSVVLHLPHYSSSSLKQRLTNIWWLFASRQQSTVQHTVGKRSRSSSISKTGFAFCGDRTFMHVWGVCDVLDQTETRCLSNRPGARLLLSGMLEKWHLFSLHSLFSRPYKPSNVIPLKWTKPTDCHTGLHYLYDNLKLAERRNVTVSNHSGFFGIQKWKLIFNIDFSVKVNLLFPLSPASQERKQGK